MRHRILLRCTPLTHPRPAILGCDPWPRVSPMRRRDLITLLGGAAAWPLAAHAQEPGRTYRLGFLLPTARQTPQVEAFFDELRLNGFVEGKNLVVVPGGFEAIDDNLAERAAALGNASPNAIVPGPPPPRTALRPTTP